MILEQISACEQKSLLGGAIVIAVEPQIECVKVLKIAKSLIAGARLKIEQKAVAPKKGYMEMYICNSNTLSSLSLNWIRAVKNSGRFSDYIWSEKRLIETTTFDELIEKYGIPQFIKIDVEGYEEEAIKGLSRPVPALSFEFTPEYMRSAI